MSFQANLYFADGLLLGGLSSTELMPRRNAVKNLLQWAVVGVPLALPISVRQTSCHSAAMHLPNGTGKASGTTPETRATSRSHDRQTGSHFDAAELFKIGTASVSVPR